MNKFLSAFTFAVLLLASGQTSAADEYQWLEDPSSPKALTWAREQSERSRAEIAQMAGHAQIEKEIRDALAGTQPPPEFSLLGSTILRFQKSVAHPHGVLSVGRVAPSGIATRWRDVLDVDALRHESGKAYDLRFINMADACLPPAYARCILSLSPTGSDDLELREFDLLRGRFVPHGFNVPAARTFATWLNSDSLLIETTSGNRSKLATGWPSEVMVWRRGAPLSSAKTVYGAQAGDALMTVAATGVGRARFGVISRWSDFSHVEMTIVRQDASLQKVAMPDRQKMSLAPVAGGRIVAQLAANSTVAGRTLAAESIVSYDPDNRRSPLQVVYTPRPGEFVSDPFFGVAGGRDTMRMIVDSRGRKRIDTATYRSGRWDVRYGATEPIGTSVTFATADREGDFAIAERSGFLVPARLELIRAGHGLTLFSERPSFDSSKFMVELRTARSKDGTAIDYFLLRPKVANAAGTPLLMTGYGAFGVSLSPGYLDGTVGGKSLVPWLNRGGALALPMIRGGGDRGEAWHLAAVREKRQNSYDDFAAVTEDLIRAGFTKSARIGVFGTSNGGLLSAVMGTQRPDLYAAIVSDAPLTDLIRLPYMGMGAAWLNEYGDPADPATRSALEGYSPFQNVVAGKHYPPFLITVASSDNRVGPGHARKLAAKLLKIGAPVYFIEDQEGGHGVSDPLARPELMADRMTFLINQLMDGPGTQLTPH